jgi:glucose-1-phosphate adenylyltransferase
VTIGARSVVACAVVDQGSTIGPDARVGRPDADLDDSTQLTLVGRDSHVPAGADLPAGARLEPGSS